MSAETKELQKQEARSLQGAERPSPGRVFVPRTDIGEREDALWIAMDVPGADRSSIDLTLEDNVLTVRARVTSNAPEGQSLAYAEYGVGNYERSFTISEAVDRDRIEAKVRNGVLQLTLPKAKSQLARKIDVRSE